MVFDWKGFQGGVNSALSIKTGAGFAVVSLRDASKACGVSTATLCRATNGNKIDVDTLLKICTGLNLDIRNFIIKKKTK